MKKYFFPCLFILLTASFISCKKNPAGIRIRFTNASGTDIQQAKADNTSLGNIKNGANTGYILFEQFGTDTGAPDCGFTGLQNGIQTGSTSQFYWCGTEKSALTEGEYELAITIVQRGNVPYFHLQFR
jgi:hypothetical protein